MELETSSVSHSLRPPLRLPPRGDSLLGVVGSLLVGTLATCAQRPLRISPRRRRRRDKPMDCRHPQSLWHLQASRMDRGQDGVRVDGLHGRHSRAPTQRGTRRSDR